MDKLRRRIDLILSVMVPMPQAVPDTSEPVFAEDVVPIPVLVAAEDLLERYGIISVHGFLKNYAGLERLLLALEGRFQTTLTDDGTDEAVVELPPEMLALAGWKEGDVLEIDQRPDGVIVLSKTTTR